MVAKVVSSAALPFDVRPLLHGVGELVAPAHGSMSRRELLAEIADASALISLLTVKVDRELLEAGPGLRIVANFAVGWDNVDVAAATERGVLVTNTPEVLTDATADLTFTLLLAAARRLGEAEALARSGEWTGWEPGQLLGLEVSGRVLGIVGLGRIGAAVARRAGGFGMEVLYSDPQPSRWADEVGARRVAFEQLLADSDFVTLHCPLTPETRHIIDARALERMKPTAVVVNTARGACVDEGALAGALASGQIAGAGLDVYEQEPAIHPGLLASRRAVLAPHVGSATTMARKQMAEICAKAVRDALTGGVPRTALNREVVRG